MKRTSIAVVLMLTTFAALLAACGGTSGGGKEPTPNPDVVEVLESRPIADFTLTDQDGAPFSLRETDGQIRLFYFGYTSCPDICPTTMVDWRDAAELLGEDAGDVRFIMITVDPENDTPAVLKSFLENFNTSFTGLSGSAAELQAVWDEFDVLVKRLDLPDSATGHSISHSASTWVVDADGNLLMKFRFDSEPEDIASGVRELLKET